MAVVVIIATVVGLMNSAAKTIPARLWSVVAFFIAMDVVEGEARHANIRLALGTLA